MAVYTTLDTRQLQDFVSAYGRGRLVDSKAASEGVENTTYFLRLADGQRQYQYVLTLFEQLDSEAVRFYADVTRQLAETGLPVPSPLLDRADQTTSLLAGKPAILVPRVPGQHPTRPSLQACRQIGRFLGQAHKVAQGQAWQWAGPRSLTWLHELAQTILPTLGPAQRDLLRRELAHWATWEADTQVPSRALALPKALIHGDLFRDNSLFQRGRLSGVIDFFSAGTGYLLFDLAVVVNDWCSLAGGQICTPRYDAIVSAYIDERPLMKGEGEYWNGMLRLAALRFWVSRLAPSTSHPGTVLPPRDPRLFERILRRHHTQLFTIT